MYINFFLIFQIMELRKSGDKKKLKVAHLFIQMLTTFITKTSLKCVFTIKSF